MTAEDGFDIDVYGDIAEDGGTGEQVDDGDYYDEDEHTFIVEEPLPPPQNHNTSNSNQEGGRTNLKDPKDDFSGIEKGAPASSQGMKRKNSPNDHHVDSGATLALMVSDLHWWITEDDVRGWVNKAGAEDELNEVTFSEHKVNGKSKG
jgi:hypothetical protein